MAAILCFIILCMAGGKVGFGVDILSPADPVLSPDVQLALTNEQEVAEMLSAQRWSNDGIEQVASRITSLPDQAACELLWRLAFAPHDVDLTPIFTGALESASPRVRVAAEAVIRSRENSSDEPSEQESIQ